MIHPDILEAFKLLKDTAILPLTTGLINHSYKVTLPVGDAYFLQQINTSIFQHPEQLPENYVLIQQHLNKKGGFPLPAPVRAGKDLLYKHEKETWRCFKFVPDTYSPQKVHTAEKAYEVANCFGQFTALLHDADVTKLHTILPHFHNLQFRYQQLMEAEKKADEVQRESAGNLLKAVTDNDHLLRWYNAICQQPAAYPVRIMHHDCKISNILFDKVTDAIVCPIDLDTTQPGLFFSDLGDMVRTLVPTLPEDAANVDDLDIIPEMYDAAVQGYLCAMAPYLTPEEKKDIHYAGAVLVYMQAIRFLADYLNGNTYYKVSYERQNWDRAANQLRLLRLLQQYTSGKKGTLAK